LWRVHYAACTTTTTRSGGSIESESARKQKQQQRERRDEREEAEALEARAKEIKKPRALLGRSRASDRAMEFAREYSVVIRLLQGAPAFIPIFVFSVSLVSLLVVAPLLSSRSRLRLVIGRSLLVCVVSCSLSPPPMARFVVILALACVLGTLLPSTLLAACHRRRRRFFSR